MAPPYTDEKGAGKPCPSATHHSAPGWGTLPPRLVQWCIGEDNSSLCLAVWCTGVGNLVPPPCAIVHRDGERSDRSVLMSAGLEKQSLRLVLRCTKVRKPVPPSGAAAHKGGETVPPPSAGVHRGRAPVPPPCAHAHKGGLPVTLPCGDVIGLGNLTLPLLSPNS